MLGLKDIYEILRRASGLTVAMVLCAFFAASAYSGENSLTQKQTLNDKENRLRALLAQVREDRAILDGRVASMSSHGLDADRLEEEVREVLGYAHPDEIVIYTE